MAISDSEISRVLDAYLENHPDEAEQLAEPRRIMGAGRGFASRRSFPMHVTVGALLVRDDTEILLIDHLAYGITLQPGGHLEPTDADLCAAALRELTEETGLDPASVLLASHTPVYVEYGRVPARPNKNEPAHHHLDIGYAFTTADSTVDVGCLQESEVTGAAWYQLETAERLVGHRIARAVGTSARQG